MFENKPGKVFFPEIPDMAKSVPVTYIVYNIPNFSK